MRSAELADVVTPGKAGSAGILAGVLPSARSANAHGNLPAQMQALTAPATVGE
jgi:hypothetical protein